jgi:hypothetical protein
LLERLGGAAVDVFEPSFLRAICSNSLVRNIEIRRERLVSRYQQKCQQSGRLE